MHNREHSTDAFTVGGLQVSKKPSSHPQFDLDALRGERSSGYRRAGETATRLWNMRGIRNWALFVVMTSALSPVLVTAVDNSIDVEIPLTGKLLNIDDGYVYKGDFGHDVIVPFRTFMVPVTLLSGLGETAIDKAGNE